MLKFGPISGYLGSCGGGRGAGDREKRGREKRGREAGEKGKNYTTLRERKPTNTGQEPGLKPTVSGRFKRPCSPPQQSSFSFLC